MLAELLVRGIYDTIKQLLTPFVVIPMGVWAAAWIIYGVVMALRGSFGKMIEEVSHHEKADETL